MVSTPVKGLKHVKDLIEFPRQLQAMPLTPANNPSCYHVGLRRHQLDARQLPTAKENEGFPDVSHEKAHCPNAHSKFPHGNKVGVSDRYTNEGFPMGEPRCRFAVESRYRQEAARRISKAREDAISARITGGLCKRESVKPRRRSLRAKWLIRAGRGGIDAFYGGLAGGANL